MKVASSFLALSLTLLLSMGCNRESPPGGPGAEKSRTSATTTNDGKTTTTTTTSASTSEDRNNTFTIEVPSGNTNVTQGERTEVRVKIDRGSKFEQDVTLKFKPATGLKVEPASVTLKKGEHDTRVTIHAEPNAPVGSTNVEVSGTPASGAPTSVKMGIDVKKHS